MDRSSVPATVRVWDLGVRVGHWLLVTAFVVAYLTEGEPRAVHTFAGYTIVAYVLARMVWGFIGPPSARFASFVVSPLRALRYLLDLPRGRAARFVGHSPAGGLMVMLLLVSLAGTTAAGLMLYAVHDGAGPLAGLVAPAAAAGTEGDAEDPREEFWGGDPRSAGESHAVARASARHGCGRGEPYAPREPRACDDHGGQARPGSARAVS